MNGRSKNSSHFSPQIWVSHLVFSIVSDACEGMDLLVRARAGGRGTKGEDSFFLVFYIDFEQKVRPILELGFPTPKTWIKVMHVFPPQRSGLEAAIANSNDLIKQKFLTHVANIFSYCVIKPRGQ